MDQLGFGAFPHGFYVLKLCVDALDCKGDAERCVGGSGRHVPEGVLFSPPGCVPRRCALRYWRGMH